jgi:hypothetical protein
MSSSVHVSVRALCCQDSRKKTDSNEFERSAEKMSMREREKTMRKKKKKRKVKVFQLRKPVED